MKKTPKLHIDLRGMDVKANSKFLSDLFKADLEDVSKRFDFLDHTSMARQPDKKMTLEKFLELNQFPFVGIQICWHRPEITYMATAKDGEAEKFVWVICPFSQKNYSLVKRLFKKSFGKNIEEF